MIEILCWAPTRQAFVAGMTTTKLPVEDVPPGQWPALATVKDGVLTPIAGLHIDEIGPITKVPPGLDGNGNVVTPPVIVGGFHANLLVNEPLLSVITADLPQTDDEGNVLPLFERTRILDMIPGLAQTAKDDKPAGYTGRNGVRMFDSAAVTQRRRVWFGV